LRAGLWGNTAGALDEVVLAKPLAENSLDLIALIRLARADGVD
jgi:hypothetical protein